MHVLVNAKTVTTLKNEKKFMLSRKIPTLSVEKVIRKIEKELHGNENQDEIQETIYKLLVERGDSLIWKVGKSFSFGLKRIGWYRMEYFLRRFFSPMIKRF